MSETRKDVSISGPCYKKLRTECRRRQKPMAPVVERIVTWALDEAGAPKPKTVDLVPLIVEVAREKKLLLPTTKEEIAAVEIEVAEEVPEDNKPKLHAGTPVSAVPMTPRGKGNVESF